MTARPPVPPVVPMASAAAAQWALSRGASGSRASRAMAALTATASLSLEGAALVPAAAFVAAIDRWQIWPEERVLAEHFGAEYERYRAGVPRWLGPRSLPPVAARGARA